MRERAHLLLEKINALAGLSAFPDLSRLEMDLLQQHLRDLYALIDDAKKNNTSDIVKPADETIKSKMYQNKNEYGTKQQVKQVDTVQLNSDQPLKQEDVSAGELKNTAQVSMPIRDEDEPLNQQGKGNKPVSRDRKTINEQNNLGESLNERWKNDVAELHQKLSGKPLRELVDLNKRIAITSELFGSSAEQFGQALSALDTCNNFESAEALFNQMAEKNNWNMDSQTVRLLYKLLRQRYGV